MQLSDLQRYILTQALTANRATVRKEVLLRFYTARAKRPTPRDEISAFTKEYQSLLQQSKS